MATTVKELQRLIESNLPRRESKAISTFSDLLFDKASPELFSDHDPDSLLAIAVGAFRFMQQKLAEDIRVRVYNPSFDADGWDSPHTVLELTLKDRPFVVDSVRAELRRQEVELLHFLHPILRLSRDQDHNVIRESIGKPNEGVLEAYELYFLGRLPESEHGRLKGAITDILEDVVLATDDYGAMRTRARELSQSILEPNASKLDPEEQADVGEYAAFMAWLDQDNFVFLGYREYRILEQAGVRHLQVTPDSGLGIFRKVDKSAYQKPVPIADIPAGLRERVEGGRLLVVTKTNAEATVHRPARMDYIGVKRLEGDKVAGEQRFVGLFTSKALSTPVEETPILRRKLAGVLARDNAPAGSHDFKQIVTIFDSMPREELFWADVSEIHREIRTIMSMAEERGVRLTVKPDPLARGLAVMVIMTRDRFNALVRRRIQELLFDKLRASHVDYRLAMGEDEAQVRFHFFFTTTLTKSDLDVPALEGEVYEIARSWDDHLSTRLIAVKGDGEGRRLARRYSLAFDEAYKSDNTPNTALRDIENIETLGDTPYLADLMNPLEERFETRATHLKIYHQDRTLVLSDVLPILENLGLRVLEQISYGVYGDARSRDGTREALRGIDIFRVQDRTNAPLEVRSHKARLVEAFEALLSKEAENDRLNQLVLYAALTVREVALLRAYAAIYAQLSAVTSRRFIYDTLIAHPKCATLLYRLFAARFGDPAGEGETREARVAELKEQFMACLNEVASLPEDRTLRGLLNLMEVTLRSNYFLGKPYFSFKLDSAAVTDMPEPRPFVEVAVVAPDVEGVHLRGGPVARGGVRWSDRPDDYRTEVLGLMKTQMTKNAVIVPVGSKGGFVVKNTPADRDALREHVKTGYRTFIRGLLDVTDNIVAGEVVHPAGLSVYDGPDAYLVVAADKGTATFSDEANAIAAEYDVWLGDAFASGGSHGYDHKKVGITARGAWRCVERHFREMGVNVFEDTFTVVGIGDMAGDVFGNGMLHTPTLKLQAAFNHQHIFLDPNPDPAASFDERRRLFELPGSSWADYDRTRISEGGGVYARASKSVALSPQVREMLGTDHSALSGQDLVRALLKLRVDLLWNGGIGTYVKASGERHADVGDSGNDAVRIDASEMQARVVGEGGNLGLTQLARIEYARAGGRINTDAIDNAAGVDMSDHEVNIKIMLQLLLKRGDLSFAQRNRLLKEMTDEVSARVLQHNYDQSLTLSLAERRSRNDPALFESLTEYLSERGVLKPEVEFLPTRRAFAERARAGEGLLRPELAILLAYTKMGIYGRLLETDLPDAPHLEHYLLEYFPTVLQERYSDTIREHPLRREIVATQLTNTVVDRLGISFVHRSVRDTGASPVEVIQAALVALEILGVNAFLPHLFALDNKVAPDAQYGAIAELVRAVEGIVYWTLLGEASSTSVGDFIDTYREPLQQLRRDLKDLLPEGERGRYQERLAAAVAAGFPSDGTSSLAAEVTSLDYLPSGMGVIDVSRTTGLSVQEAATHFYAIGERLALGWLRDRLAALEPDSKWEKIAVGGLIMDLRRAQRQLTVLYAHAANSKAVTPDDFLTRYERLLGRYDAALADIRAEDSLGLASGGVLSRVLSQMVEASSPVAA